jgi:excisionase family DNA binding protein
MAATQYEPRTVTVAIARSLHPAVGRNAIYQAMRCGALEHVRVGKRIAIPTEQLDAWVMRGCPTTRT